MNKSDVTGGYEDKGMVWVPCPDGTNERGQKLFSTAYGGWMAHYYRGLLFVKCFPDIRPDEAPPGQGEVEIFVSGARESWKVCRVATWRVLDVSTKMVLERCIR